LSTNENIICYAALTSYHDRTKSHTILITDHRTTYELQLLGISSVVMATNWNDQYPTVLDFEENFTCKELGYKELGGGVGRQATSHLTDDTLRISSEMRSIVWETRANVQRTHRIILKRMLGIGLWR
jgi:hypothetical protein